MFLVGIAGKKTPKKQQQQKKGGSFSCVFGPFQSLFSIRPPKQHAPPFLSVGTLNQATWRAFLTRRLQEITIPNSE